MNERRRDAHVRLCRDTINAITSRLEVLRSLVERLPVPRRIDIERELDRLRGLRNRAVARAEDARFADDISWDGLRSQLDAAVETLLSELRALEQRLSPVAA